MRRLSATILLIPFVLAVQGYAQSITGSLNGRVVDQQGSAVPNARVTATEPTKKLTVATNTTEAGDFSIAGLAPGAYTVTVEATGFKKLTRPDVALDASDKIALGDLVVQIGSLAETIEISATAMTLQTESSERGSAVTGTQIANINVDGKLSTTILLFVFVLAVQGYAQSITGSLNGRVVDQQGSRGSERQGYRDRANQETDGRHEYNRRGRLLDRRIGAGHLHRQCRGEGIQEIDASRRCAERQ